MPDTIPQPDDLEQLIAPDYSRLSYSETALVLKLSAEGLVQAEIAQRLQCSQSTVHRVLHAFQDSRPLAIARLHNNADRLAEAAIHGSVSAAKKGKTDAVLELLHRLNVADKRESADKGTTIILQQGLNLPGMD